MDMLIDQLYLRQGGFRGCPLHTPIIFAKRGHLTVCVGPLVLPLFFLKMCLRSPSPLKISGSAPEKCKHPLCNILVMYHRGYVNLV